MLEKVYQLKFKKMKEEEKRKARLAAAEIKLKALKEEKKNAGDDVDSGADSIEIVDSDEAVSHDGGAANVDDFEHLSQFDPDD